MKKSDFKDMTKEKYKVAEEIANSGDCGGVICEDECPLFDLCYHKEGIIVFESMCEFLELFKDEYGQDTSPAAKNYKDLDLATEYIEDVSTHEYIERLENQIKLYEKIINHLLEEK